MFECVLARHGCTIPGFSVPAVLRTGRRLWLGPAVDACKRPYMFGPVESAGATR
jgi:hypothetical protein